VDSRRQVMTRPTRNRALGLAVNAALVALAFSLLGFVIWQNRAKIHDVFSRHLDLRLLALAFAIYMVGIVLTFVRWFFLVRVIESRFALSATMLLGFIGLVFNLVIPGAVGGDLIKAAYLVRMHIKKTQAIASMVIDRIIGLLALFVLASIAGGLVWQTVPSDVRPLIMAAWVATGLGVLVLTAIFAQAFTRLFPGLGHGHSRLHLIVAELKEMSTTYRRRLDVVATCGAISLMNHSLNVVAFYLVGRMLFPAMTTTLAQHFLMAPLTLFTMAVPIPFGALGLTEGVSDQLFNLVKHPSGGLAMMGFRVVMYGGALVGAIVYLAKLREVRGLTASAHRIEEELIEGDLEEPENGDEDDQADGTGIAPA
jgi:glycosyltransferase 2 family protein